ncbi:unnamed protein product, partial [Discosporangium mesarthrocarpum]
LTRSLGIPKYFVAETCGRYTPEEALFAVETEFPNSLDDLSHRMEKEHSQMGRVVKVMVKMVQKFGHMLTNGTPGCGLHVSRGQLVYSLGRRGCRCKSREAFAASSTVHLDLIVDHLTMWNRRYKRNNGIKFQGVVLPNGIIADLWGPVVGRRHDG